MKAAEKNALTSAALTACIMECTASAVEHATKYGRTTLSVVVSARRLAEEYGAPPAAKQPRELAPVPTGGRLWTVTCGKCADGWAWTARAEIALQ